MFNPHFVFLWHNHCSENKTPRVKDVDDMMLMGLECPYPCTDVKGLEHRSTFEKGGKIETEEKVKNKILCRNFRADLFGVSLFCTCSFFRKRRADAKRST